MATDRDGILVQFQDFTGVADLQECKSILNHHKWNLQAAVQSYLDGDFAAQSWQGEGELPSTTEVSSLSPNNNSNPVASPCKSDCSKRLSYCGADDDDDFGGTRCGPPPTRLLHFMIKYRDTLLPVIALNDNCTVGDIKEKINLHTAIPVDVMTLHGWIHKNDSLIQDTDVLCLLRLPKENTLTLRTPCSKTYTPSREMCMSKEHMSRTYELDIYWPDKDKHYTMKFLGSRTIKQVKEDVVVIFGPVRQQIWDGWLVDDDSVTLAESGINYPNHCLTVTTCSSASPPKIEQQKCSISQVDHNEMSYDDDEEDADDASEHSDDSIDSAGEDDDDENINDCRAGDLLIPDGVHNQLTATEHFCRQFAARYGEDHPAFFFGSLGDAVHNALQCKAREQKLLVIYLHHDHSAHANFFCSKILCNGALIELLAEHFILWPWDITCESNRHLVSQHCREHFDDAIADMVCMLQLEQLPALLIASRNRGANEIIKVIHGSSSLNQLMHDLREATRNFHEHLPDNILEEEAREARECLRRQQEKEYLEALEIDKAKAVSLNEQRLREQERQRRAEEEKLKQQQREEEERQRQLELQHKNEEAARLAQEALTSLPEEPCSDCALPTAAVRFCCPDRKPLTRRFLMENKLLDLLNFVVSAGFMLSEFSVMRGYPRQDLTQVDTSLTLDELKFCRQGESLLVARRPD